MDGSFWYSVGTSNRRCRARTAGGVYVAVTDIDVASACGAAGGGGLMKVNWMWSVFDFIGGSLRIRLRVREGQRRILCVFPLDEGRFLDNRVDVDTGTRVG